MQNLQHHHSLRKRITNATNKSFKAYPHPNFWIRLLDRVTVAAGIIGPLMVLPQIVKIYSTHSAAGVSALSWLAFTLVDIPFIAYGIVHKDKPIISTYICWFIANAIVAVGAVLYG